MMKNKKKFAAALRDLLDSSTKRMLDSMVDEGLIERREGNSFAVSSVLHNYSGIDGNAIQSFQQEIIMLKSVAQSVFSELFDERYVEQQKMADILKTLAAEKAFKLTWDDSVEIWKVFDEVRTSSNPSVVAIGESLFKENRISPILIANAILEFYGIRKAEEYFKQFNYLSSPRSSFPYEREIDLALANNDNHYNWLLFEFKIRWGRDQVDEAMLVRALSQLAEYSRTVDKKVCYILMVYTTEPFMALDNLKKKFDSILKSIHVHEELKEDLIFQPVSIESLHLMHLNFDEFKNEFIEGSFEKNFQSKLAPKDFPARNDDFYYQVFDLHKSNVVIDINPGQTEFWRFGCRFAATNIIGPVIGDRHSDPNYYDIHIYAGEVQVLSDGAIEWTKGNYLGMTSYFVSTDQNTFHPDEDYRKQPVQMRLEYHDYADILVVSVMVGNKSLGQQTFRMEKHVYFKMFAWADYNEFLLKVKVTTKRKYTTS